MEVIEYPFELGLVIENFELLIVMSCFIQISDIVPNLTDLVFDVFGPEVRFQLLILQRI